MRDEHHGRFRADWAQKDFYAELGVKKDATADEIKKAYRKLARANHPDSNPGDTAKHDKFKAVAEAYDVVGDPEKRAVRRDAPLYGSGRRRLRRRCAAVRAAASTSTTCSATGPGAGAGGFGDMFGDLFGGGGPAGAAASAEGRRRRDHGDDQVHRRHRRRHDLAAADLRRRLPRLQRHRRQARHEAARLPRVRGRRLRGRRPAARSRSTRPAPCAAAASWSTTSRARPATAAAAALSARSIQARIPAGVKDGQRIRLRGKGAAGENGGPAGDLFVNGQGHPAPALRPQGRQPDPRRTGLLRRGRRSAPR